MLDALDPVDQWNDSQATLGVSRPVEEVEHHLQGIIADDEDLTVTGLKVARDSPTDDGAPEGAADSPLVQANQAHSVAPSVHSLPVRHTSATHLARPSTAPSPLISESALCPSGSVTQVSVTASRRQLRHRSSNEPSRSTNRLSGFFSNLIHRRDTMSPTSHPHREQRSTTPVQPQSAPNSRPPSPPVPARPTTPPPSLSSPTLHELGLSLSAITTTLSPSHFSTPPTSGAFLAPHYLLLCHAQGLDVLPLVSPPAPQPYTLVRRASFKCVVVMEHRGVLVAIAGRRDGVRVYALEEVKRAIEWRIEAEIRRERERTRREEVKKMGSSSTRLERRQSTDKKGKLSASTFSAPDMQKDGNALKPSPALSSVMPKKPRPPTSQPLSLRPVGRPPPYTHATDRRSSIGNERSTVSVRSRRSSRSLVVVPAVPPPVPTLNNVEPTHIEAKLSDWQGASDDEAIDMLTAGASGSQALDERTSSIPPGDQHNDIGTLAIRTHPISSNRWPSLQSPSTSTWTSSVGGPVNGSVRGAPDADVDEDDEDNVASVPGERITLVQALLESRLPGLPPAGTLQPQEPILIANSTTVFSSDNESSNAHDARPSYTRTLPSRADRRRRWSTLGGIFSVGGSQGSVCADGLDGLSRPLVSTPSPSIPEEESRPLTRSLTQSRPSTALTSSPRRPSTSAGGHPSISDIMPSVPASPLPRSSSHTRILPRFFSSAFGSRRNGERAPTLTMKRLDADSRRGNIQTPGTPHASPPKLEYVKLPDTKGALMIKAVETQKKSFLAILCGENGEKVELFAGTYRTALGLSRTFILPDSPKSLELQLQGDDLVEVFLMFSQNVFGLEPATVRVREVRIGRAERRAARRRVREIRSGQTDIFDTDPPVAEDEDTNINISPANQGISIQNNVNIQPHESSHTPGGSAHEAALAHAEELVVLASAQIGPYTTFQQLSFAPKVPLAAVSDDYIIPPTYTDFLGYRAEHEPDTCGNGNVNLATIQFNPPGLPMPAPSPPSRWCYRDPRGNVHGPWQATLMQAWYKDGLLPPDLPVRKETDEEFILLKDLRLQCVDPVHPFRSAPPPPPTIPSGPLLSDTPKPLLPPVSLLMQPRHFGPPPLFYSSRGGHSTSIVDARGRAVVKGRFVWSPDEDDVSGPFPQRMGDVKRLEAFDIKDRSVIVAMRQGGLEAMDFGDALLKPADESRSSLPHFCPPPSNISRRVPFTWKIGMPINSGTSDITPLSSKTKTVHIAKKTSYPAGKSPARNDFTGSGEGDSDVTDEVLFLGRSGDDLYLCERTVGTFRILRLCPEKLP